MAENHLEEIIHKLLHDPDLRREFERDRAGVLAGFPLNAAQRSTLLSLKLGPLVTAAHGLSTLVDPRPI